MELSSRILRRFPRLLSLFEGMSSPSQVLRRMKAVKAFVHTHSKLINVAACVLLSCVILICHLLILILFLQPSALLLASLLTPDAKGIKPTTVVTLVGAVLAGATSALVTRAVEQSLWLKLSPRDVKNRLTVGECLSLAQWSVSPLARILYLFDGSHWLLKAAGVMVVATAVVSPVLVSGISQIPLSDTSVETLSPQGDQWAGWLDVANSAYNGGNFADVPGVTAALAYLGNLSAPASPICSSVGCSLSAVSQSIRANCKTSNRLHPQSMYTGINVINETYTSSYNPDINVVLRSGSPYVYVNFTGGWPAGCESVGATCRPGEFSVIFGAFINATDTINGPWYLNTVDCLLTIGTVRIHQEGGNSPTIEAASFQQNTTADAPMGSISPLHRIYTDENAFRSPYTFEAATGTGDGADSIYQNAVATLLLHPKANSSGEDVALRMKNIFEMSTLLAFSRSPYSSDLVITRSSSNPIYVYDRRVLAILLLPLIATILGTWGRWRITGNDIFVGYDPVEIARRGPVDELSASAQTAQKRHRNDVEKRHVWCVQDTALAMDGAQVTKVRFAVG
jgi:hypothetical protein